MIPDIGQFLLFFFTFSLSFNFNIALIEVGST